MKRIAAILLMILYVVPVVGVTVSAHYCGSINTSVSYNPFDTTHKCLCGSMKMQDNCCKDQNSIMKLDNDQHKTQQVTLSLVKSVDFYPIIDLGYTLSVPALMIDNGLHDIHHPPDDTSPALFLFHRVLLI
jgi:hypothetical protein